jgi:hypothetical protein
MIILGVVMELNFHRVGGEAVYLYYPVILLAVTVAFLINPLPIFALQGRKRLLVSLVSTNGYTPQILAHIPFSGVFFSQASIL